MLAERSASVDGLDIVGFCIWRRRRGSETSTRWTRLRSQSFAHQLYGPLKSARRRGWRRRTVARDREQGMRRLCCCALHMSSRARWVIVIELHKSWFGFSVRACVCDAAYALRSKNTHTYNIQTLLFCFLSSVALKGNEFYLFIMAGARLHEHQRASLSLARCERLCWWAMKRLYNKHTAPADYQHGMRQARQSWLAGSSASRHKQCWRVAVVVDACTNV